MSDLVKIWDKGGNLIQVPRAAAKQSAFIAMQLAIDDLADACAPAFGATALHAVLCGDSKSWQALSNKQILQSLNAAHYLDLSRVLAQLVGICRERILTPHLQAPLAGTILSSKQWKHLCLANLGQLLGQGQTTASAETQAETKNPTADLGFSSCPVPCMDSVHLDPNQHADEPWRFAEICMDSLPQELVDMLAAECAAVDEQGALLKATVWMGRPDLFRRVAERLANPCMSLAVGSCVQFHGLDVRFNGAIGILASPPVHGHVAIEIRVSCSTGASRFGLWCPPKIRRERITMPVNNVALRYHLPVGWTSVWDARRLVNVFVHYGRRLFQQTLPPAAFPGEVCDMISDAFGSITSICARSVLEWQHVLLSCGLNIDEILRLLKPTGFKHVVPEQAMQLQIQRMQTMLPQSFHGRALPVVAAAATPTFNNAGPAQHGSSGIKCCAAGLMKLRGNSSEETRSRMQKQHWTSLRRERTRMLDRIGSNG